MEDRLLALDVAGLKSLRRAWEREARRKALAARDAARKARSLEAAIFEARRKA